MVRFVHLVALATALAPGMAMAFAGPSSGPAIADDAGAAVPGCVVGVFRDDEPVTLDLDGLADIEASEPIDGDTLFYAASVSKQFTALAVAQLAAGGELSLDDDVRTFIPELPDYGTPITLSMLMHHTSGIRDFLSLLRMAGLGSASVNSRQIGLELLYQQKSTNFPPGTRYLYSNGGYLLLAEVVARVSGEPFPQYLKRHVLDPLGMHRSHVLEGRDAQADNVAHGYVQEDEGFVRRDTYPRFGGSGGLMTSMNDLSRYHRDLASGGRVWTPAVRALILAPGRLQDGDVALHPKQRLAYAGGLLVGERNGHRVIQHGGSAEAFRTFFAHLPDDGIGAAALCNRSDRSAQSLAEQAIATHVAGFARDPGEHTGIAPGRYHSVELGAFYDLSFEDSRLIARIQSEQPGTRSRTVAFEKDGEGRYVADGYSIAPAPDGPGILLGSSRASGILARPIDTP